MNIIPHPRASLSLSSQGLPLHLISGPPSPSSPHPRASLPRASLPRASLSPSSQLGPPSPPHPRASLPPHPRASLSTSSQGLPLPLIPGPPSPCSPHPRAFLPTSSQNLLCLQQALEGEREALGLNEGPCSWDEGEREDLK